MPGTAPGRLALLARVVPMLALALVTLLVLARPQQTAAAPSASTSGRVHAAAHRVLHPELHPRIVDPAAGGRGAALADVRSAHSTAYSVDLPGGPRGYVLHVPADLPVGPRPLVLVLAGLWTSAQAVERSSDFDAVADAHGAVVVYADGIKDSWNAGHCCGYAAAHHIDDRAALRGVVDAVETQVDVDRRRVVIAGFSNGGMLAYRFACEQARGVAGIIVVSGALVTDGCAPAAPVAVVVSHGLSDHTVPDAGQTTSDLLHTFTPSVAQSVAPFVAADTCTEPRIKRLPPYKVQIYRQCQAGVSVTVFRDDTLGHSWPGPTLGGRSFSDTAYSLLADRRSPTEFR